MDFCARTGATKGAVSHDPGGEAGLEEAALEGPAQLQGAGHRDEADEIPAQGLEPLAPLMSAEGKGQVASKP